MEKREWRLIKFLRWLWVGLILLFTTMALACLILPLIPEARKDSIWILWLNFFLGAPMFGCMAFTLTKSVRDGVTADDNGLEIRREGKKWWVEWPDVQALWTTSLSENQLIYLSRHNEEIKFPAGLANIDELKAFLESKTNLEFGVFPFGPAFVGRVIEWQGSTLIKSRRQTGQITVFIWLAFLLVMGRLLLANFEYLSSELWPPLLLSAAIYIVVTIYGIYMLWREFKRLYPHRNEKWRFDAQAITREKDGETLRLPLKQIESLQQVDWRKCRASGNSIVLEWPQTSNYLSPEEDFLSQNLKLMDREIIWQKSKQFPSWLKWMLKEQYR